MSNVQDISEQVSAVRMALLESEKSFAYSMDLKGGDGGGTSAGMDSHDHHGRISRLEGAAAASQWAIGVVSAALIGGMALLIGGMALLWNDMGKLQDKVDALPAEIRSELQSLTSTLAETITAARSDAQPAVIVIPEVALGGGPARPGGPSPGNPSE